MLLFQVEEIDIIVALRSTAMVMTLFFLLLMKRLIIKSTSV
jgi:hypothetical protein